jgi:hypothetical protein
MPPPCSSCAAPAADATTDWMQQLRGLDLKWLRAFSSRRTIQRPMHKQTKQTNKTNKQRKKQTNKQTTKQTNNQTNNVEEPRFEINAR